MNEVLLGWEPSCCCPVDIALLARNKGVLQKQHLAEVKLPGRAEDW